MRLILFSALPLVAMVALSACQRSRSEPTGETEITSSQIPTTEGDRLVAQRVEEAIGADARLAIAARNVTVASQGGIVTLTGSVPDEATRKRVDEAVRSADGVLRTVDRLVVSPSRDLNGEESDPKIERSIIAALRADDALAPRADAIVVTSKNGIVTLRGNADTAEERDAIERKADRMPGVVTTVDQIEIGLTPAR
jgi:osmotically-inducible protein OsmY